MYIKIDATCYHFLSYTVRQVRIGIITYCKATRRIVVVDISAQPLQYAPITTGDTIM